MKYRSTTVCLVRVNTLAQLWLMAILVKNAQKVKASNYAPEIPGFIDCSEGKITKKHSLLTALLTKNKHISVLFYLDFQSICFLFFLE